MKKQILILIISLLTLILSGCAHLLSPTSRPPLMPWKMQQQQLMTQPNWDVKGNIGIHTATSGNSASFVWQQRGDNYNIQMFGPFGAGHVALNGDAQHITLQTADQKIYTARNPERLLQQRLGWKLPVSHMRYWVRGLPAPHIPASYQFDATRHLKQLMQEGWRIDYEDYMRVHPFDLPSKITLDSAKLHVRIVIWQWQLNP